MATDSSQHDFDQRHDGPFETAEAEKQGRFSLDAYDPRRTQSECIQSKRFGSSPSPQSSETAQAHPKGVQTFGPHTSAGRKSEDVGLHPPQPSRTARTSRDFDVRRDGPYGRPSLNMRRKSSGVVETLPGDTDAARQKSVAMDPVDLEALSNLEEQPVYQPEPPPLNYNLWSRKWFIVLFWSLLLVDVVVQPIALYFGLWYGLTRNELSANAVFSIVTACIGGVSTIEYIVRFRRLFRKNSTCRVIGARRMYLDWFHWNFTVGWFIIIIELIVGTTPENPPIRLLSMPLASMLYAFGTELLIVDTLRFFKVPAPVRMSSIPKGAQLRPAIYSIIEDVVAVDGSGGTAFREALNKRYESSHVFRAMLRRLGLFWSFGAEGMAILTTVLIFSLDNHEVSYVIGWSAPFVWAGIWVAITIPYVKWNLKLEKKAWAEEVAGKEGAVPLQAICSDSVA